MSSLNYPPLSIVDLNADCLFHIFSYLQLQDLLNFRLQCFTLNHAVRKYFPKITKLSIVYTEYGPEGIPSKNLRNHQTELNKGDTYFYSSDWLNVHFKDITGKFAWRKESIVIFGRQKYERFLEFIVKHKIRNITKLGMIVDLKPSEVVTLSTTSDLLELCPKIETLFLERAERSVMGVDTSSCVLKTEDLDSLFNTIARLASLRELNFFTWPDIDRSICLTPDVESSSIPDEQVNRMFGNFLSAMFKKLSIIGFNYFCQKGQRDYLTPLFGQNFENILELDFDEEELLELINSGTRFNNLHSLTLFGRGLEFQRFNVENSFERLNTLRFCNNFELDKPVMLKLNSLPNLKLLSAPCIEVQLYEDIFVDGNFEVNARIEDRHINKRIKFIEIERLDVVPPESPEYDIFFHLTDFFQALETVTISPLKGEDVVYDRNTLKDLQIGSIVKPIIVDYNRLYDHNRS